MKDLYFSSN